jgi:hypothetical protein
VISQPNLQPFCCTVGCAHCVFALMQVSDLQTHSVPHLPTFAHALYPACRLVPMLVFVVVPFMELLLPVSAASTAAGAAASHAPSASVLREAACPLRLLALISS